VFKARFADCDFYENIFPALNNMQQRDRWSVESLRWQIESDFWNDPRTNLSDTETQKILHLTRMMEQLPDAFTDAAKVTRSNVPAANTPARIQHSSTLASTSAPRLKRGRPAGAADKQPRQQCIRPPITTQSTSRAATVTSYQANLESDEMSVQYVVTGQIWDRMHTPLDNVFAYQVSQQMMDDISNPKTI
jgi:hypothetical protein